MRLGQSLELRKDLSCFTGILNLSFIFRPPRTISLDQLTEQPTKIASLDSRLRLFSFMRQKGVRGRLQLDVERLSGSSFSTKLHLVDSQGQLVMRLRFGLLENSELNRLVMELTCERVHFHLQASSSVDIGRWLRRKRS
jgi:hypothetical protein